MTDDFRRRLRRALFLQVLISVLIVGTAACYAETGMASFYGGKHHGRRMANGQIFNQMSDSCAHKTYPFGTALTVTYGGRSIRCVVRDRGPYIRGRIIDVSVGDAQRLGMIGAGVGHVTITR